MDSGISGNCDLCLSSDGDLCRTCEYEMDIDILTDMAVRIREIELFEPALSIESLFADFRQDCELYGIHGFTEISEKAREVRAGLEALLGVADGLDQLLGIKSDEIRRKKS